MDKPFTNFIVEIIIVLGLIGILILLSSCAVLPKSHKPDPKIDIPDNPTQLLYRTVYKTNWLITLSIIGVAFAMAAFLNGSKMAIPIGIGCLTALGLSLAVIRYATWLAALSGVAAVVIFGATILMKNNALKQIIIGVQKLKSEYVDEDVYEREKANNVLADVQDKNTTKLVMKTKANLKLNGKIT